jgi:hypothetical protein
MLQGVLRSLGRADLMSEINAAIAVFGGTSEIERAIRSLRDAGFESKGISVVARDLRSGNQSSGHLFADGILRSFSEAGRFWEKAWRLLNGWGCFQMPGIGLVLAAGPLAEWIFSALGHDALFAGMSSLGAALCSIGIARSLVPFYEAELKACRFLLVAHGSTRDVRRARRVLEHLENNNGKGPAASAL